MKRFFLLAGAMEQASRGGELYRKRRWRAVDCGWLILPVALSALYCAPAAAQFAPRSCAVSTVATGGTAVVAAAGPFNGGYIVNPLTATDQGIATAESLYVDPTTAATTTANGTNVALAPGQTFYFIAPGQGASGAQPTYSVNAATSGHKFTCVRW